ncbi:MAG: FAD-binding protein [Desulfobacterales bacterium]
MITAVKYSHGKTVDEAVDLRHQKVLHVPDIVVHPKDKNDVRKLSDTATPGKSDLYILRRIVGNLRLEYPQRRHHAGDEHPHEQVININELNQTATVQPGMFGPAYEEALNNAPKKFNVKHRYTCGHFPQSFEFSTVGGWVVTLGSGQASAPTMGMLMILCLPRNM